MNVRRLKDFDFAVQAGIMAAWGWSLLRQGHGESAGLSLALLFPAAVMWAWAAVDSWRRWREEGEDERVRQLILTAGYISRQTSLVCLLGLLLASQWMPLGPVAFALVMTVVLVGSDLVARRWLGLRDEELRPERSAAQQAVHRVTWAAALGFLVLLLGYMMYVGGLVRESVVSDPGGWGLEKPGSPEQAAKAKAAGVILSERDKTPAPVPAPNADAGVRAVRKKLKTRTIEAE